MTDTYSLQELNNLIKTALRECFPDRYWVRAELSEVRTTGAGHCYVEFIEKENRNGNIVAKMRGNIWANTFRILKPYFENETGQPLASGMKVLVQVSVDFHEVYGPSLTVSDIDPTFTLGDMARQRMEIIKRLQAEQLFDLNKEIPFPILPRRLAIISSATAAGYDDFTNQLRNNPEKYSFFAKLFPAIMQGGQAEASILKAFDSIDQKRHQFDVVLIIRGGGAVSDLSCFDNYQLAKRCATFPLPVITGIGHERDESILDMVAHTRTKTPTAAAEFLISCFEQAEDRIKYLQESIQSFTKKRLESEKNRIQMISTKLSKHTRSILNTESLRVNNAGHLLKSGIQQIISQNGNKLKENRIALKNLILKNITKEQNRIVLMEQIVQLSSPENMLRKGYTLTMKEGKIIRSTQDLNPGDLITTLFADGEKKSIITR